MTNTMNTQTNTTDEKTAVAESRLYNLLFTGRISVREYLQGLREASGKTKAA